MRRLLSLGLELLALFSLASGSPAHAQEAGDTSNGGSSTENAADENWENRRKRDEAEPEHALGIREIVEPKAEYNYASFGRPDPFVPPDLRAAKPEDKSVAGKTIQMTSALQAYAIAELRVKGVWQTSQGETRAVVQTPKGEGVVVKKGDPISSGKVLRVERDKVMVRLYRLRADGVREYEDVVMPAGIASRPRRGEIRLEPGKAPVFINPDDPSKSTIIVPPLRPAMPAATPTATLQGIAPPMPLGMSPPPRGAPNPSQLIAPPMGGQVGVAPTNQVNIQIPMGQNPEPPK